MAVAELEDDELSAFFDESVVAIEWFAQLLEFLESRYPAIRHRIIDEQDRIRPHIRFFVNGDGINRLHHGLHADDEVIIVAALSGG